MDKEISHKTYRLIDASVNRVSEGLRFLDDVARFVLDDAGLSRKLRALRHNVVSAAEEAADELIASRNTKHDVGADAEATPKGSLRTLVRANFRRVQEGLRTLEESGKLPAIRESMDTEAFRKARFEAYSLEKEMLPGLSPRPSTGKDATPSRPAKRSRSPRR